MPTKYGEMFSNRLMGSSLKKYVTIMRLKVSAIVQGMIEMYQTGFGGWRKYSQIITEPLKMQGIKSCTKNGIKQKKIVGKISRIKKEPEEYSFPCVG